MHHRSDFIWLSHHVISESVFLNRQQIHSERKKMKNWTETKTYRSNSTCFLHHLHPILRNDFSCRSESTEKPILAVTPGIFFGDSPIQGIIKKKREEKGEKGGKEGEKKGKNRGESERRATPSHSHSKRKRERLLGFECILSWYSARNSRWMVTLACVLI